MMLIYLHKVTEMQRYSTVVTYCTVVVAISLFLSLHYHINAFAPRAIILRNHPSSSVHFGTQEEGTDGSHVSFAGQEKEDEKADWLQEVTEKEFSTSSRQISSIIQLWFDLRSTKMQPCTALIIIH